MKKTRKILGATFVLLTVLFTACRKDPHPPAEEVLSNQVILTWNQVAFEALGGAANQHSLLNSRIFALVHVAMHDAVNAATPQYRTYAYNNRFPKANPEVAAASAAHHVLKTVFAEKASLLDSALAIYLATVPASPVKNASITAGIDVANTLLALGHNSTGLQDPAVLPKPAKKPGDYKVVPPFPFIFAPFWEDSKPFALKKKDQFRPVPPPALNSQAYTASFHEVKALGSINSTTRTPQQTAFAKYWYEFSEVGWNRIARVVATDKKSGLHTTARLFALLHMAMADSYIAGWEAKQYYNLWRPFTAIREANTDGNPHTTADTEWTPAENTPPIQDYPSTHSTLGNAAAAVLAAVYGDKTTFTMQSPTAVPANSARTFKSFTQAANENADSRVMAGLHFRFACQAGQELGTKIGQYAVNTYLKAQ